MPRKPAGKPRFVLLVHERPRVTRRQVNPRREAPQRAIRAAAHHVQIVVPPQRVPSLGQRPELPHLRQEPDARFLIVGAAPPLRVRRLARLPGVEVTGYVHRIQDYLVHSSVAVAPMQAGSGIQNKVLEAMASGTPVVATPNALGGIETREGEHVLVARDAEGLAEQVVRLLKDPALRPCLARNARRLVENKYTWERSLAMLEEVYRLAIEQRSRGDTQRGSTSQD